MKSIILGKYAIILCVIQGVKNILIKLLLGLSLYQIFWNVVSDWPCTFLHPGCFCLALLFYR